MLLYERILFSTFFIYTSLNIFAYPPAGRSGGIPTPIPKIRLSYYKPIFYNNPITYILFFARMMREEKNIPRDITNNILQYSVCLKNKDFKENFPHKGIWDDFHIPIQYQYLLTAEQLNILGNVFKYRPQECLQYEIYSRYYYLKSKKDYKLFLQLPIEVRSCLTKLPQTTPDDWRNVNNTNIDRDINKKKKIFVLNDERTFFKKKFIIPGKKRIRIKFSKYFYIPENTQLLR